MNLLKIISIIGLSTIANLLSGFLKGKIMAVYFGSSGLGIWSQATNLFMIGSVISLFGLNQGLIKQIASKEKNANTDAFVQGALFKSIFFSLTNSLVISLVIIFWVRNVSAFFFNNNLGTGLIIFIAAFLPFQAVGDVFGAFLLANKEIKKFAKANILISIFGLLSFIVLTAFFKLRGAYLSVGAYGVITFMSFYLISRPLLGRGRMGWHVFQIGTGYWDFLKDTLNFGALRLIQVTINPINMLLIRSLIIKRVGLVENGFFDALTRISIFYTPFITNILWSYAFPVYCGMRDNRQLGYEVNKFVRLSLILFVPVCIAMMLFGNVFVNLLFSKDFIPIISLFSLWFIVDLLRVTAWPMNIILIAKDRMRLAVSLELFWNAAFLLSAFMLIGRYSLKGVVLSYILSFFVFLFVNYVIMNKDYAFRFNARTFSALFISALLIIVAGRPVKSLPDYVFIFTFGLIFFTLLLDKQERALLRDAVKKVFAGDARAI